MIKSFKRFLVVSLFFIASIGCVSAESVSITISGNGSESVSEVSVQSNSTTSVSQSNDSNVSNNVSQTSNTGNNSTSDNTNGDTSIVTGDIDTSAQISNTNLNINVADTCCQETNSQSVTITQNGSGSQNTADISNSSSVVVNQDNQLNLQNSVAILSNTGRNTANGNTSGSTAITTGKITSTSSLVNKEINLNVASVPNFVSPQLTLVISGNGANSTNNHSFAFASQVEVNASNLGEFESIINSYLNTGNSKAKYNTGAWVSVVTGEIRDAVSVINRDININFTDLCCGDGDCEDCDGCDDDPCDGCDCGSCPCCPDCEDCEECDCCEECDECEECNGGGNGNGDGNGQGGTSTDKTVEKTTETITNTIERYYYDSSSPHLLASARGGRVLGAMLPATGNNVHLLIANMLMFLLGSYLRLRSGRSPSYGHL